MRGELKLCQAHQSTAWDFPTLMTAVKNITLESEKISDASINEQNPGIRNDFIYSVYSIIV